ncbi:hypothetical protein HBH61_202130 [Parastagonospora nodorum]|nr:hypothetical protein HBI05_156100 [Parastagonospora nodorum]KAH4243678.1 hypothetical protein HBI06_004320 [Parastagonospora nodorum]KAH4801113.1 hypothetical protein HBH61_202130 [Parastagonospora nodorum]KAH4897783.1 hypothetical protein HBH74_188850 [Parastagonospora nodorum]KAH4983281.1 hypothetical protein HBH73_032380 [Parastagonospora nodorum]
MLTHSALARLAAANTSARNLPQLARFLHRTLLARNASDLPAARALTRALNSAIVARRCYATTTSATTPTATVKKAVKAQAVKKPAPRKTAATKKTRAAAKKPAAAKSKPKKKAAPKQKVVVKKRVKKVLTPEEQRKAKIAELRKRALKEPVGHGVVSSYAVFVSEHAKGSKGGKDLAATSKETAAKYKELTPAEREHYNHLAAERTAARRAEYKAWIQSHTPAQIQDANKARSALRRLKASARSTKLVDDRQVKQPPGAYIHFFTERKSTPDFRGISVQESAKLIGAEWKALNAGEKKKYEDQAAASKVEYQRQVAAAA